MQQTQPTPARPDTRFNPQRRPGAAQTDRLEVLLASFEAGDSPLEWIADTLAEHGQAMS